MASIYQHWTGTMLVEAAHFPAARHPVDQWIPEEKPASATRIAAEEVDSANVFNNVIVVKGQIGPVKIKVDIDLAFTGTIEYWQV